MAEENEEATDQLRQFLITRGVKEDAIQRMEEEKIDLAVLAVISDEKLKNYLPKYGDRIAVIAYAKKTEKIGLATSDKSADRKLSLAQTLKTKMASHFTRSKSLQGNSNAKKQERRVEVGWLDYHIELKGYKQVKTPSGGGIKHATFDITTPLSYVLEQSKKWFFPDGKNRRGHESQFDFFVTDSTHLPIDEKITVGEMYEKQKAKLMRLYLASQKKEHASSCKEAEATPQDSAAEELPTMKPVKRLKTGGRKVLKLSTKSSTSEAMDKEEQSGEDLPDGLVDISSIPVDITGLPTPSTSQLPLGSDTAVGPMVEPTDVKVCQVICSEDGTCLVLVESTDQVGDASAEAPIFPGHSTTAPAPSSTADAPSSTSPVCSSTAQVHGAIAPAPCSTAPVGLCSSTVTVQSSVAPTPSLTAATPSLTAAAPSSTAAAPSSTAAALRSQSPPPRSPTPSARSPIPQNWSPTPPPRSPTPPPERVNLAVQPEDVGHQCVYLHRAMISQEMIVIFKDPGIMNTPIKVHFIDEAGADAQGVSREAYSAFWREFFLKSTCGENERVPIIFPEFGMDEWQAVGRILLKGYSDVGVFPLQLSYAFTVAVVLSEFAVTPEILLESFRMYLSESDRDVIDSALRGESLDEESKEDFLDLLSRVDCHTIPDQDSVRPAILSIAHKELIQEPKYANDNIANTAREGLIVLLPDAKAIRSMYEAKKPTARKVVKLLDAEPQDQEQSSSLAYLIQFIKGIDPNMLRKFLRHFTGAEVICTPTIKVSFNKMRGLGRAPQAHTCGPLIELPSTYSSYSDLRSEFYSILESNYLKMDII